MAVSAIEFWQQLTRIGIVDSATGVAWMKRFEAGVTKRAAAPKAPTDHSIATDAVAGEGADRFGWRGLAD